MKKKKTLQIERNNLTTNLLSLECRISELTTENRELSEGKKAIELESGILKIEKDEAKVKESELASRLTLLESSNSHLKSRISELTTENSELAESKGMLESEKEHEHHWHMEHKQRAEQYKVKLEEKNIELGCLEQRLLDKEKQLSSALALTEKPLLDELVVEKLLNNTSERIKKEIISAKNSINWRVDKGLNNSVKQLESYIGVQSFLESGEVSMEYHGWPISSDIALFLLGKIQSENYDLIIEFGSGTSTKLFAQAVKQNSSLKDINQQQKRLSYNTEILECSIDIPQRVLTFEHNKKYYEKTLKSLCFSGLETSVNLVHAPLVNFTCDEESYLYYDCDKALQQVANIYEGRTAKILVLIDGPPGATGPLARLPAVTKLLNNLGSHQLDLVLDDYNREEEKEIAERWKKTISARFIHYEEEIIPCEKGAWLCRVNA